MTPTCLFGIILANLNYDRFFNLNAIDLFCGCGGLSLGLERAGINILAGFENWQAAISVYEKNFVHPVIDCDLSDPKSVLQHTSGLKIDMIAGGPPCQDFSHAGKRKEADNASLTGSFTEICLILRPEWIVMENVERARTSRSYRAAKDRIRGGGYGITEIVLNAALCGAPQRRKRFFMIGKLGEQDGFLTSALEGGLSNTETTVRDYLGSELGVDHYYRHPRNYNRRGIFSIDEPAPTVRGVNRPIPMGYKGHPRDTAKLSDRLRPLTTLERARLQTFPRTFIFEGTKTDLEQLIGNAVPVELAKYVGSAVVNYEQAIPGVKHAVG